MLIELVYVGLMCASSLALKVNKYDTEIEKARQPAYIIHPLLANRSSQREFTGDAISDGELESLFEASRWAPSGQNTQPWRFVYALKDTPRFDEFIHLLVPANQVWAKKAPVLAILIAANYNVYNGKVYLDKGNVFDSGTAYLSLALEATSRGFSACDMGGIYHDQVYQAMNVTRKSHTILIMIAIGNNPDQAHRKTTKTITPRNEQQLWVFWDNFVNTDPIGLDNK